MINPGIIRKVLSKKYFPHLAAISVSVSIFVPFIYLGTMEKERDYHEYRSYALSQLGTIRARLENVLNSRLIPLEGLSAYISTHPEITRAEFDKFAKQIMERQPGLHTIEMVKGTIIHYIYPLEGHEKAIGLDLIKMPAERDAIERAIAMKKTIFAGPVDLVEGGVAFISRSPIYIAPSTGSPKNGKYWGLTQGLITTNDLFKEGGLYEKSDFHLALRGKDATGPAGEVFFGDKSIFQSNPITLEIKLPEGSWQLAAIPKAGWDSISSVPLYLKIIRLSVSIIIGFLVFVYLRSHWGIIVSEHRHRIIFNNASVSIWEEDFSEAKKAIDELKARGITDFRKYFHENPDFVIKAAQMIKVIDVNDVTIKLYKAKSKEELFGSLDKVFTPESYEVFKEVLVAIAEGKTYFEAEAINKNLKGEPLNMHITITIPSETSEFKNLLVSISDITERKQAEERSEGYRQNLEKLLLTSKEITTTTDLKSLYRKITTISKELLKLDFSTLLILSEDNIHLTIQDTIGFPESMIGIFSLVEGQGLSTYVVKNKAAGIVTAFNEETRFEVPQVVFEKKITSAICVPMILKDEIFGVLIGHTIDKREFTDEEISLYQGIANQSAAAIKNSMNILALGMSEMEVRDMMENVPVGINISTPEGRMIKVNTTMLNMFGYEKEEFLNLSATEIYYKPEDRKKFLELHDKGSVKNFMVLLKRKDRTPFWGSITAISQRDEKGDIQFLNVIEDITERKQAEEILREYNKTLEEQVKEKTEKLQDALHLAEAASRAKSEFLANMSHELRTPLNAVIGFSELMSEGLVGPLSEKQIECLNHVLQGGRHLLLLINDILDISRIEADKIELEPARFDLKKMLEDSVGMFKERASKKDIKTSLNIGEGIDTIYADERRVRQVLLNLLSNAYKFTPNGGSVTLTAHLISDFRFLNPELKEKYSSIPIPQSAFLISVEDTGIGISEEDQKRLFTPFEQLENVYTKKYEGTGLGLYLSKRLVEMHGGNIWVESKKDVGSKFTFFIPTKK